MHKIGSSLRGAPDRHALHLEFCLTSLSNIYKAKSGNKEREENAMRFSSGNNLNVTRVLKLLREGKCLKKVPNKTVEHYSEDPTVQPDRMRRESPRIIVR